MTVSAQDGLFYDDLVASYVSNPRFLRRDWLAGDVAEHLAEPDCRFILLTAEPGAGKSGFIAQLAADHSPAVPENAWLRYFIRRDQLEALGDVGVRAFLLRIGFQFAALHPELFSPEQIQITIEQRVGAVEDRGKVIGAQVEKIISNPFHQAVLRIQQEVQRVSGELVGLRVGEFYSDPQAFDESQLQNMALFDPARALARLHPENQVVVLIDALDELRYHRAAGGARTVLDWLIDCPEDALPANVHFVLTSRPPDGQLVTLIEKHSKLRRLTIDSEDSRVQIDIRTYAARLVEPPEVAALLAGLSNGPAGFVAEAVNKAEGNIGYLDALARGIDHARSVPDNTQELAELLALHELPKDISGLYTLFLHQIKNRPNASLVKLRDPLTGRTGLGEAWPDLYAPLLAVFVVALEPPTLDQLHVLSGTFADRPAVVSALDWLSQFLDQLGGRYRLYHSSLAEFLVADSTRDDPQRSDLYIDPIEAHRAVADILGQDLDAIWADTRDNAREQERRQYARLYMINHLYQGRDWQRLFAIIDAGEYGQGKLHFDPSTYLYARDLDLARDACLPGEAAQLERLALLPRLWRYSLLRGSLAGYAGVLPPDAFIVLTALGKGEEAVRLALLIGAPEDQALIFSRIAETLVQIPGSEEQAARLLRDAFGVAARIVQAERQGELLASLTYSMQFMLDSSRFYDQQAVDAALRLAQQMPEAARHAAALRALAGFLSQAGQREAATTLVREMEQMAANGGEPGEEAAVNFELSGLYAELGDWGGSFRAAARLVKPNERAAALAYLAACQQQAGLPTAALEDTLAQGLELASAPGLSPFEQGDILFALARAPSDCDPQGKIKDMLHALISRVEAQDPGDISPEFWTDMAAAAQRQGEGDFAVELLMRAKNSLAEFLQKEAQTHKTGPGYSLFLRHVQAASDLARLGQWPVALEVAGLFQPVDRINVLRAVVEALVSEANWAKAFEVTTEIARLEASSPVLISFSSSSSGGRDQSPSRAALYTIIDGLAQQRNWDEALQIAGQIDLLEIRCQALSRVALGQLLANEENLAADTLARQERTIRTWGMGGSRDTILSGSVDFLIHAADWGDARAAVAQISDPVTREGARSNIAAALIEAGDLAALEALIAEMDEPGSRTSARIMLARKRKEAGDEQGASAALAEARAQAMQIEDGATSSADLRRIAVLLAGWGDTKTANQVIDEAADAWGRARPYGLLPTPVSSFCVDIARVGNWDWGLKIAHGLVEHNAFDGTTALINMTRYCHEIGRDEQAEALLAEAGQAVLKVDFPPMRDDIQAQVAVAYAETGLGDMAAYMKALPEAVRMDATLRIAQARISIATETSAQAIAEAAATAESVINELSGKDLANLQSRLNQAQAEIAKAWLQAGEFERALETAAAIRDDSQRLESLIEISAKLFEQEQRDEALRILEQVDRLTGANDYPLAVNALIQMAGVLAKAGETGQALALVQREWRRSDNLRELVARLPMAAGLASGSSDLGKGIYSSVGWVEAFLASG